MAVDIKVRRTYQDYLALTDADDRCELIDGEYCAMPSPNEAHQDSVLMFAILLRRFVMNSGLGKAFIAPFDVILSPNDVFQPDVIFLSNERMRFRTGDNIRGAPDLVVEVLSPSTAARDRGVKRDRYARFGVREYWIADLEARLIEVLVASDDGFATAGVYGEGDTLQSPLLPGLRLDVSEVFAGAAV